MSLSFALLITVLGADPTQEENHVVTALIEATIDEDKNVRTAALDSLAVIKPKPELIIDVIRKRTKDEEGMVRLAALRTLVQMDADVETKVRVLMSSVFDKSGSVSKFALQSFPEFGEKAVPYLIEALKRDDSRLAAVHVLRHFGPEAKAAVPELLNVLKDDDPKVREYAAHCLGNIFAKQKLLRRGKAVVRHAVRPR